MEINNSPQNVSKGVNSFQGDLSDKLQQDSVGKDINLQKYQDLGTDTLEEYQDEIFKSDDFRMYKFKVFPCSKRYYHDWTTCAFSHIGEKAKRRDPLKYKYIAVACPDMKKLMSCVKGDQCPLAHSVFEYWLHPSRYRTQMCNQGPNCKRKVCFFAHQVDQLRTPVDDFGLQTFMENGLEYPTLPVDQLYINFDKQDSRQQQVNSQIESLLSQKMRQLGLQQTFQAPSQRRSLDIPLTSQQQQNALKGSLANNAYRNPSQPLYGLGGGSLNNSLQLQPISESVSSNADNELNALLYQNSASQSILEEQYKKQHQLEQEVGDAEAYYQIQNKIRNGEISVSDLPVDLQDAFRRRSMDTIYTLLQAERQNQWASYLQRSYFSKRGLSLDQQQEALKQMRSHGMLFQSPHGLSQNSLNLEQFQQFQNVIQQQQQQQDGGAYSNGDGLNQLHIQPQPSNSGLNLHNQAWLQDQLGGLSLGQPSQRGSMDQGALEPPPGQWDFMRASQESVGNQSMGDSIRNQMKRNSQSIEQLSDLYR